MESQQMMEPLLAMNEKMATKEDRKIDREEMIQEIRAAQENIQENLKKTMEEILSKMEERMTATQAKTDGKLKELTDTTEKTQAEPTEEMMQSAGSIKWSLGKMPW
jgi:hypothetical protein